MKSVYIFLSLFACFIGVSNAKSDSFGWSIPKGKVITVAELRAKLKEENFGDPKTLEELSERLIVDSASLGILTSTDWKDRPEMRSELSACAKAISKGELIGPCMISFQQYEKGEEVAGGLDGDLKFKVSSDKLVVGKLLIFDGDLADDEVNIPVTIPLYQK